jgi:hypothetical protein
LRLSESIEKAQESHKKLKTCCKIIAMFKDSDIKIPFLVKIDALAEAEMAGLSSNFERS